MIQIDDAQMDISANILKEHVDASAGFQELILEQRHGRERHTFMHEVNIDRLKVLLATRKEHSQVFDIPYHLKESGEPIYSWSELH